MDARRLCTMRNIFRGGCAPSRKAGAQGAEPRAKCVAKEIDLYRWAYTLESGRGGARPALRRRARFLGIACAVFAAALVVPGCASKNKRDAYNVRLSMDVDNFRSPATGELPSIDVDVIAANASEEGVLKALNTREYFDANNPYRASVNAFRARFTNQDHGPKKLSRRGTYWDNWKRKGARTLYIIANLPERPGENPDLVQTRSVLALPLDRKAWPNGFFRPRTRTLKILIQPSGLVSETTQRRQ